MIKVTYTCDKCKKELDKRDDLYEIQLFAKGGRYTYGTSDYHSSPAFQNGIHWCNNCLETSGFFNPVKNSPNRPEVPPTMEDLLRDIISSVVVEQIEQQTRQ